MSTKEAAIEMIKQLPDDVTMKRIIEELAFRQNVEEGLRELDAGQGIPHEEAKKRLAQWLQ